MLLKPEPLFAAVREVTALDERPPTTIFMTPQGQRFDQKLAFELAEMPRVLLLCGHYEGVDERVRERLVDREISIGDYVLSGGELAAMVVADALIRLQPGVIKEESFQQDSFAQSLLDHPHYTRPAEFEGMRVPDVLLSGHHANIEKWRAEQSRLRTAERRPDLL